MFRLSALRLRLEHETQAYAIIDSPLIMAVDQEMDPWDFPLGPVVKNPLSNAGDIGSIPLLELRSYKRDKRGY